MVEKIGHIKNPLTVISIFAAIAEISGTTVLPFIQPENQSVYIWFLMLFPMFLVGVFFVTLNFNHKVLYAPSDYKNEDNFIKSFGKATLKEKEEKLLEEVEETEGKNVQENKQPLESDVTVAKRIESARERHQSIMENVTLAEKLSINKLSKELGIEFKTNVRFETPSSRKIIFDGLAIHKEKLHAVDVKYFRNDFINPSRLDRVLLESELMVSQLQGIDSKEFILHLVAVADNSEINLKSLKAKLTNFIERYNVNVKIHVVTLSDLKNEYQYNP